eukprot:scaffold226401_cov39-Tisochrysis_lutea.AAC.1
MAPGKDPGGRAQPIALRAPYGEKASLISIGSRWRARPRCGEGRRLCMRGMHWRFRSTQLRHAPPSSIVQRSLRSQQDIQAARQRLRSPEGFGFVSGGASSLVPGFSGLLATTVDAGSASEDPPSSEISSWRCFLLLPP